MSEPKGVTLPVLDYAIIEGRRHWPQADGNFWGGLGQFTDRENLLADWLDQMKRERDAADRVVAAANRVCAYAGVVHEDGGQEVHTLLLQALANELRDFDRAGGGA